MTTTARLVPPGWVRSQPLGAVIVLYYEDGSIRIEHACRVIDDTQIVCAPALRLGDGHSVVSSDPLTVVPSILCPDCGLHGFITAGAWSPA
ncbi:MAG TPA: hypothetical protein VK611_21630 [Acidimicrobiales bacterium]|nr:hypothetical protein [Acidimicrobiales bacterium]